MPTVPHAEKHFLGSESVRDVVIGMADGLTVPFALAAGLSAAVRSTHVVVTAGLAEVIAGATAMGLVGIWPREPIRSTSPPKSAGSILKSTGYRSRKKRNYERFSKTMACKALNSTLSLRPFQKTRNAGRSS